MNFFNLNNPPQPGCEHFETLCEHAGGTIERIASNTFVNGQWYDQEHDEWVMLMQGSALMEFDNHKKITLSPGDYLLIKAHQRHRVVKTSEDTLWLAIHFTAPTP